MSFETTTQHSQYDLGSVDSEAHPTPVEPTEIDTVSPSAPESFPQVDYLRPAPSWPRALLKHEIMAHTCAATVLALGGSSSGRLHNQPERCPEMLRHV